MALRASSLLREKIPGKKKEVVVPPRFELELTVSKTILNSRNLNKINFSKELDFRSFYFL